MMMTRKQWNAEDATAVSCYDTGAKSPQPSNTDLLHYVFTLLV